MLVSVRYSHYQNLYVEVCDSRWRIVSRVSCESSMSDDTSRGGCLPRGDVVSPYDASCVYWSRSQNMICSSSEADHIGPDSCSPDYINIYNISLWVKFQSPIWNQIV